jgi:predicted negative regulator of RcsB-dependent stress response
MAYDLEEQEQIAQLRAWWEKYGNLVLTIITVVMLAFAAYNGWRWYQARQSSQAARMYEELQRAIASKDTAKAADLAQRISDGFGGTVYAALAALQAARVNYDSGDAAKAKQQLQSVIERSGFDELGLIARVRLAGILLDEKSYDEALKTLAVEVPQANATAFDDRRGDVLLAQKKVDEARAAYRKALEAAGAQDPLRSIIQLKLDALPSSAS